MHAKIGTQIFNSSIVLMGVEKCSRSLVCGGFRYKKITISVIKSQHYAAHVICMPLSRTMKCVMIITGLFFKVTSGSSG